MLTESEKAKLVNKIKKLVRESIAENSYFENVFPEKKEAVHDYDADSNKHDDKEISSKKDSVLKWLDTAQELHSVLAYELWPDMDEDTARSLFSKKYRGHDDDGNSYHFDDEEINDLYNMRDDFIQRAGLSDKD